jgi:hypothetical protein
MIELIKNIIDEAIYKFEIDFIKYQFKIESDTHFIEIATSEKETMESLEFAEFMHDSIMKFNDSNIGGSFSFLSPDSLTTLESPDYLCFPIKNQDSPIISSLPVSEFSFNMQLTMNSAGQSEETYALAA